MCASGAWPASTLTAPQGLASMPDTSFGPRHRQRGAAAPRASPALLLKHGLDVGRVGGQFVPAASAGEAERAVQPAQHLLDDRGLLDVEAVDQAQLAMTVDDPGERGRELTAPVRGPA